jgi:hypothetical protein
MVPNAPKTIVDYQFVMPPINVAPWVQGATQPWNQGQLCHHTNIVYKIIPKPKLRSVPPSTKECIYITPPMVLVRTLNEPKRGHELRSTKW